MAFIGSGAFRYHDLVSSQVDLVGFQGAWGRPGNHLAVEIVAPIMAGAPDEAGIAVVLHGAV